MTAQNTVGLTMSWNAVAVAGTITSLSGPNLTNESIEVTSLASTATAYIASLPDIGEVTLEVNYDPDDAGPSVHDSMADDLIAGQEREVIITWPDTTTIWTFDALCTGLSPGAPVKDKLSASITLQGTGALAIT